jgi:DNA-binding XRE family transcriptional regulator
MIRNDAEYQQALARLTEERARIDAHVAEWSRQGFKPQEVERLRAPLDAFHLQLLEETQSYERLLKGEFSEFENLDGLGQLLIGLRVARGMTQRQLAQAVGVDESQVSRDERNEYYGISVERARKILEALGARVVSRVELNPDDANPRPSRRAG